ncbi:hypothetical protein Tco_1370154 [Tanacetum coccineum]
MVPNETRAIEKCIGGLPQPTRGNVLSSKPIDIYETIEMAHSLMDEVILDLGDNSVDKKRTPSEKSNYACNIPLCGKYGCYHNGPCPPTCFNYGKVTTRTSFLRLQHKEDEIRLEIQGNPNGNLNGNQSGNKALGRVYALWEETDMQDNNVVTEIVCREKTARVPCGTNVLAIQGEMYGVSHPAKAETRGVKRMDIITTQWCQYRGTNMH